MGKLKLGGVRPLAQGSARAKLRVPGLSVLCWNASIPAVSRVKVKFCLPGPTLCVKQEPRLQDHQVPCHCGCLRKLPFPSSLPFLFLPSSALPCSFLPSCQFPTLKNSVWMLTSQSGLCYSLGERGALEVPWSVLVWKGGGAPQGAQGSSYLPASTELFQYFNR